MDHARQSNGRVGTYNKTVEHKTVKYEDRYCAFIDILGFRQIVDGLGASEAKFESLKDVLTTVHNPAPTIPVQLPNANFRAQSISDAVALSASVNQDGMMAIFYAVMRLAIDLLGRGYFVRGAIVKGRLHHDDKMVFGEALVRAYRFENEIAFVSESDSDARRRRRHRLVPCEGGDQ
jgi:hypothetical protein